MTEQSDVGAPRPHRRRRRSSSRDKQREQDWLTWLRSTQFSRGLFIAMTVLAGIYSWLVQRDLVNDAGALGPVAIGMRGEEVRHLLGDPQNGPHGEWIFAESGRTLTVHVDPASQTVAAVDCRERDLSSLACPEHLRVRIGNEEAALVRSLGAGLAGRTAGKPTRAYPALGTVFELNDGRISAISVGKPSDAAGSASAFLWRLLP